jgi:hypothetical protein
MRRFPATLLISIVAVIFVVGGIRLFWKSENQRYQAVDVVRKQQSLIRFSQTITHDKGPIAREEWQLSNLNGVSKASYEAVNRAGTRVAHFSYPITGYDVTFAFEALVRDGIWELGSRRLLGKADDVYTISVAQTAGDRSGAHTFSFTDPHYLATTAGREFTIHLDRDKPVPDLLTLKSTSSADDRYQKVVDDFSSFGPPGFRVTVAKARDELLHS